MDILSVLMDILSVGATGEVGSGADNSSTDVCGDSRTIYLMSSPKLPKFPTYLRRHSVVNSGQRDQPNSGYSHCRGIKWHISFCWLALVGSLWLPNIAQIFNQFSIFLIKQRYLKKPGIFIQLLSTSYAQDTVNCPDDPKEMTKNFLPFDLKGQILSDSSFCRVCIFLYNKIWLQKVNCWMLYKPNGHANFKNLKGKQD